MARRDNLKRVELPEADELEAPENPSPKLADLPKGPGG